MRLVSTDGYGGSVRLYPRTGCGVRYNPHILKKLIPSPDKNTIRIQCLAKRERLNSFDASVANNALVLRLMDVISATATTVAGYRSIRSEADITGAMRLCLERGQKLCLPIIEAQDKPLFFRRWRMEETLENGRYGIEVPPINAPTAKPDVILVPLVAFDRSLHRLGYGAGYYDRTISALRAQEKTVQIIGVAYSMQETDAIPVDEFDQKLDVIVTEKEVIIPAFVAGSGSTAHRTLPCGGDSDGDKQ